MGVFSEVVKEGISKELLVSSKSYIFDGAGGMRDELEKNFRRNKRKTVSI